MAASSIWGVAKVYCLRQDPMCATAQVGHHHSKRAASAISGSSL